MVRGFSPLNPGFQRDLAAPLVMMLAAGDDLDSINLAPDVGAWLESMGALDTSLQRLLRNVLVRDGDAALRRNRLALLQEARRHYTGQVRLAELAAGEEPERGAES